jgi:uncharacterized protein (DUF488 family)
VDKLIDIRARRGVRGATYSFANAKRLETALTQAGIAYTHAKDLAPPESVRNAQRSADADAGIAQRDRSRLSAAFISAYQKECLAAFDSQRFIELHCGGVRRPVLFCVEREASACHRSLVAERLAADLGLAVEHITP